MHFVMLDQNVKLNAIVLSFDDHPNIGMNFVVMGENQRKLDGTKFVLITCIPYLNASAYT